MPLIMSKLKAENVFSYNTHAQKSSLPFSSLLPFLSCLSLLLWRSLSLEIFFIHRRGAAWYYDNETHLFDLSNLWWPSRNNAVPLTGRPIHVNKAHKKHEKMFYVVCASNWNHVSKLSGNRCLYAWRDEWSDGNGFVIPVCLYCTEG